MNLPLSNDRNVSRRKVITTSPARPSLRPLLRVTNAQGLQRVKFTLPWLPEGSYAYAYVAKAAGHWRDRGYDVEYRAATARSRPLRRLRRGNSISAWVPPRA